MKLVKAHIIFLLVVIGFLTSTIETANSLKPISFLVESEIEETFDEEVDSHVIWKDISFEKSNDGGSAIIDIVQSFFSNINFTFKNSYFFKNEYLSSKIAYFILYCCLKVNC